MIKSCSAFIFDMDGVIFDSEKTWQRADAAADELFATGFDDTVRFGFCGRDEASIRACLKKLKPTLDADAYRDYIIGYVHDYEKEHGAELKPGFTELVSAIKKHGKKIALATSSHRDRAERMFKKVGLDMQEIFDAAVFGEDVKVSKPNPEIFLIAADRLGVEPRSTAVLEDSVNGIKASIAGGFLPVMIIDLVPPTAEIKDKCTVLNSLTELFL